jgi:copper chaperone CopZ
MVKMTLKIDGMMCGMCETHIASALRNGLGIDKVSASHKKNEAVLYADHEIPKEQIRAVIDPTGYRLQEISCEPAEEKKGFFSKFRK